MTKKTLKTYTLEIAREQLELRPGWFERFETEIASEGKWWNHLDALFSPMERSYITAMELWPTKRFHILRTVSNWVDCQPESQISKPMKPLVNRQQTTPEPAAVQKATVQATPVARETPEQRQA